MGFTHGTRSAMRNYHCHCDACRAGARLQQRETRARRLAERAFPCPECQIPYLERWKLAKHRKAVHGVQGDQGP